MAGPKLHPRYVVTAEAGAEINKAVANAIIKYQLTYGEITALLASEIASYAKYQVREERHGNAETPGQLAPEETSPGSPG